MGDQQAHPVRLELAPAAQQALLGHVAGMIRAAVGGAPFPAMADDLAGLVVSGAFVSLKRGKHLRSCCGGMQAHASLLGNVLPDAVSRAVFEDPRFPPVSPSELPFLDLEVWLLFNPRRVSQTGQERLQAVVTGGKHGVVVRWRDQRGLLLPGVALEHGWDAQTLLEHVCQKGGLHPSRWKDDETILTTFEAFCCRDRMRHEATAEAFRFLEPEQLRAYAEFARQNLEALLFGGTPRYAAPALPDGAISGLILSLERGAGEPWQWSKLDLQRGMALQASLFQLTQAAAQSLAQAGVSAAGLGGLRLGVFYDPALHGTVHEPDLRGVAPGRRALVVLERGSCGLAFDAAAAAEDLLRDAAAAIEVRDPAAASVFSLTTDTVERRLTHRVRPRAVAGSAVRAPAVAGSFYPADAAVLGQLVDELLGAQRQPQRQPERQPAPWSAAMVPHAGLRYSGRIAAAVFRRLALPSTVIVIGPKHTAHGMDWAVAPQREWLIPGARVASDPELARRLAEAVPLALDAAAHQQEHGIEVELPFLARLAPRAKVVGIAIGPATLADCRRIADGLAAALRDLPEPPLLLISSDMNHFAGDAETRRLDELALQCLDRLDAPGLFATCKQHHITMCGLAPAVIVLETLQRLGRLSRAERVGYATSADVSGDPSRVVGYAGVLFE